MSGFSFRSRGCTSGRKCAERWFFIGQSLALRRRKNDVKHTLPIPQHFRCKHSCMPSLLPPSPSSTRCRHRSRSRCPAHACSRDGQAAGRLDNNMFETTHNKFYCTDEREVKVLQRMTCAQPFLSTSSPLSEYGNPTQQMWCWILVIIHGRTTTPPPWGGGCTATSVPPACRSAGHVQRATRLVGSRSRASFTRRDVVYL